MAKNLLFFYETKHRIMKNNNDDLSDTKEKMALSLKKLIISKPFSKITVGDIVDDSKINRNTFYYHFGNMYDLLYWTYNKEVQNIINISRMSNATLIQGLDWCA